VPLGSVTAMPMWLANLPICQRFAILAASQPTVKRPCVSHAIGNVLTSVPGQGDVLDSWADAEDRS
jgi:hypothetical protein